MTTRGLTGRKNTRRCYLAGEGDWAARRQGRSVTVAFPAGPVSTGAAVRIYYFAVGGLVWSWRPILIAISIATMVIGTVIAIAQKDVKRVLAYSAIAHSGFLLTGIIALSKDGLDAILIYLFTYGFATIGTFAIVTLVRDSGGEVSDLNRWAGLGKRSPLVAGTFTLCLLGLA